jgi:hypothetical protein
MKIILRCEGGAEQREWPDVRSDVLARALIETIFRIAPDAMHEFYEKGDEITLCTRGPLPAELRLPGASTSRSDAVAAQRNPAVEAAATRRAERLTEMTATIAAGIWGRNDPVLDIGDVDSKMIVAKLARATAELILEQETVDVR